HALLLQAQFGTPANALRNPQGDGAIRGRNLNLGTLERFTNRDGKLEDQVVAVPPEERMVLHPHMKHQVTALLALASQSHSAVVTNPWRYADLERSRRLSGHGEAQLALGPSNRFGELNRDVRDQITLAAAFPSRLLAKDGLDDVVAAEQVL